MKHVHYVTFFQVLLLGALCVASLWSYRLAAHPTWKGEIAVVIWAHGYVAFFHLQEAKRRWRQVPTRRSLPKAIARGL